MNATSKKKLCWNCEGSAPLTMDNCPYCGVYLNRSAEEEGGSDEEAIHAPPYQIGAEKVVEAKETVVEKEAVLPLVDLSKKKEIFFSSLFLLSGSVLLFFGFLLLLFSRHGILTLQWDGSYWPIYFGLGIPLLILGSRFLRKLD